MSPAPNFERSNEVEICNGIMFDFCLGLPHMYVCLVTSKFSGADIKSTNYNENTGIALLPDLASSLTATSLCTVSNRKVGDRPSYIGTQE